jgi:hypothetical protein
MIKHNNIILPVQNLVLINENEYHNLQIENIILKTRLETCEKHYNELLSLIKNSHKK